MLKQLLSNRILLGLLLGLCVGTSIQYLFHHQSTISSLILDGTELLSALFIGFIKLLIIPLVFTSIVSAVVELKRVNNAGGLGLKTFTYYLLNTVLAVTFALSIALIAQPGNGASQYLEPNRFAASTFIDIIVVFTNLIPQRLFQLIGSISMLQVIVISFVVAAIVHFTGKQSSPLIKTVKYLNQSMMKIVSVLLWLAPVGVFALTTQLSAYFNIETLTIVFSYALLVIVVLVVWIFVVYPLVVLLCTGISPLRFIKGIRKQVVFALKTSSSIQTIPVTMQTLTDEFNVPNKVAAFGVPLGAIIHKSGVAIYITIATVFISNFFAMPIDSIDMFYLALTVLLLSIGTGGFPGGSLMMIGVLIYHLGLPIEGLVIITALDRLCDVFCTTANVVGDTVINTIVAKSEAETEIDFEDN